MSANNINFKPKTFPRRGRNYLNIFLQLYLLIKKMRTHKARNSAQLASGHLMTYPSRWAILVWRLLVSYNPGNLGNWTTSNKKNDQKTGIIESEVVAQMLDLYQAKTKDFGGYFTSGATEANIFSAWLGRKKLMSELKGDGKICLLRTSLSHYSISKAADVVGVDTQLIAVRRDLMGMDLLNLKKRLERLYHLGNRGFLLPLTYGFTLTGTDDDVAAICREIEDFKVEYPESRFFVWIDAALSGLIQPFKRKKWSPLADSIQTFIIDFHKFARVPQPSGLVLYKQDLLQLIEKPIDYLEQNDNTLLGSRTGISPVAAWANLQSYGESGLRRIVKHNFKNKRKFIDSYSQYPELKIITSPHNLNLGLIIKKRKKYWSNYFGQKYDVLFKSVEIQFPDKKESLFIGKVFFISA